MSASKKRKDIHRSDLGLITDSIEEEIEFFGSYLDQFESNDLFKPSEELRRLSEKIFYIHSSIERLMEIVINEALFKMIAVDLEKRNIKEIYTLLFDIHDELDFRGKLRIVGKLKLLSKEDTEKIEEFNRIRNKFAHPRYDELKHYVKNKQQLLSLVNRMFEALLAAESTEGLLFADERGKEYEEFLKTINEQDK